MKSAIQKFGKSLLLPISTIAAAGIFMGLAAALQNPSIVGQEFVSMKELQLFIGFIRRVSGLIFSNLPVFFALSITVGLIKDEKETAAFSAILGFLIFHFTINYILTSKGITAATTSIDALMSNGMDAVAASIENARYETVLGFFTYRMNVFAGVLVGVVVAWLHNRFHTIKLPNAINFFGGKRFVPLITIVVIPLLAIGSYFVWPFVDQGISWIGLSISSTGIFGPFIYGLVNRLMIPTGLHHILNQIVRFTSIGGSYIINGEVFNGALNIFNAAIAANPAAPNEAFQIGAKFIGQGHSLIAIFGLPAAAFAMIHTAKPQNKTRVKAMLLAGLSASLLTGITEPIEFAFMFVSPILYIFHAVTTGLGYMVLAFIGTSVGGVQAGAIDFTIFGILRGSQSQWYIVLIVGVIVAAVYYFGFKFLITKFNIKTPGREIETDDDVNDDFIPVAHDALSEKIVVALGGASNIDSIMNCMTRLRVEVIDETLIDESQLKKTGASGFVRPAKNNIQIVYGLNVDTIASNVKRYLKSGSI